jgi:hypothetical protein
MTRSRLTCPGSNVLYRLALATGTGPPSAASRPIHLTVAICPRWLGPESRKDTGVSIPVPCGGSDDLQVLAYPPRRTRAGMPARRQPRTHRTAPRRPAGCEGGALPAGDAERRPAADCRAPCRTGRPACEGAVMARGPDVRSGPAGSPLQPSRLTEAESLARTTSVVAIVNHDGDGIRWSPGTRPLGCRLPAASASLYEPAAGRTWWWLSIRCPHCGSVHLGRVRQEDEAPGPRRTGCGRRVWVIVRRTYRGRCPDTGAVA